MMLLGIDQEYHCAFGLISQLRKIYNQFLPPNICLAPDQHAVLSSALILYVAVAGAGGILRFHLLCGGI
jgi:hypothetical protein